jgi:hypothetical protein
MALTAEDVRVLNSAFPRAAHEFMQGLVYLTEQAVTERIDTVDPAWSFEILRIEHVFDQAIVHVRLTIKGVSREGVGMQKVVEKAGEPAKGAATDALKRAARLFGVGRYLLDNPPKEGRAFDDWLAQQQKALNGAAKPAAPQLPTQPTPNALAGNVGSQNAPLAVTQPTQPTGGTGDALDRHFPPQVEGAVITPLNTDGDSEHLPRDVEGLPILGSLNMKALGKLAQDEKLVKGRIHFANLIDLLWRDGLIRAASKPESVMEAIRTHEAEKDMQLETVGK